MSEPSITSAETVIEQHAPKYSHSVCKYFRTHSTAVATVDELAGDISDERDETQRQVAIRLHHVTLPELADTELIDYDPRSTTVRYRGIEQGNRCAEETER